MNKKTILEIFYYLDGNLYWKNNRGPNNCKDKKAGSIKKNKYVNISLNKKMYLAHRLIFLMHYGYLPKIIDHIDGNPSNNKIENLREANQQQNSLNCKISKKNTSGVKNVRFNKKIKKWVVNININKKLTYLGAYQDLDLAELVAIKARNKYHQQFARHF